MATETLAPEVTDQELGHYLALARCGALTALRAIPVERIITALQLERARASEARAQLDHSLAERRGQG